MLESRHFNPSGRQVKLIIWDLDETLWHGVLEEGTTVENPVNSRLVKSLAHSGIISSICSKNSHEKVKTKLLEFGLLDYFVFSVIDYVPKGKAIQSLLEAINLRPDDVLFVDDSPSNRMEVEFFNKGITTISPEEVYLVEPLVDESKDPGKSRLLSYKQIEHKSNERTRLSIGNEAFLSQSEIQVTLNVVDQSTAGIDRILELINRTNQLNFTKVRYRSGYAEFVNYLGRSKYNLAVHVKDIYCDYGLVGYVSVDDNNDLKHFLFSCRILDMGIEHAVFNFVKNNYPEAGIPFPTKDLNDSPPWVSIRYLIEPRREASVANLPRMLFPGLCNVEAITPFLSPRHSVTRTFPLPLLLLNQLMQSRIARFLFRVHASKLFLGRFLSVNAVRELQAIDDLRRGRIDVFVHSIFVDSFAATMNVFGMKVLVPGFFFMKQLANVSGYKEKTLDALLNHGKFYGHTLIKRPPFFPFFLTRFYRPIEVDVIRKNVMDLIDRLPQECCLVILNSANHGKYLAEDFEIVNPIVDERVKRINDMLDELEKKNRGKLRIVDLRHWIRKDDVFDLDMHYSRKTYFQIAQGIEASINTPSTP